MFELFSFCPTRAVGALRALRSSHWVRKSFCGCQRLFGAQSWWTCSGRSSQGMWIPSPVPPSFCWWERGDCPCLELWETLGTIRVESEHVVAHVALARDNDMLASRNKDFIIPPICPMCLRGPTRGSAERLREVACRFAPCLCHFFDQLLK